MSEDKTALQKAVDFLARREHSQYELTQKLTAKGYSADDIEQALNRLLERGLQSDERFAEAFVTTRYQRGQGPYKIRAELMHKGIDESLVDQVLGDGQYDWYQQASMVYQKKYGNKPLDDYRDRMKRSRFLQQRGFTAEHIEHAMQSDTAEPG